MRLLRVIPSIDPRGGGPMEGARQVDAVLGNLDIKVEVVTLDAPGAGTFLTNYPGMVHALGPATGSYGYSKALVPWLRANRTRFDAVIIDGLWQYHGLAAWRALAGTSTPYFVFTHGMLSPWFKYTYPLKHLKKWLYWPWADYRMLRDAHAVLFTCDEERRLAQHSFWLYKAKEEVASLGTVLPPQDSDGRKKASFHYSWPETSGKRIILFLGRMHPVKGCDLLIDAFGQLTQAHPSLHLVMAGPDQMGLSTALKQQAERLGITDRITWTGMLQGDEKWGAFHAAEVFCLPSHQENFGIVVAEALGCGKPVLISDKVNIWREVAADGAGIVRPDTLEGTADALRTWLGMAPAAQDAMRAAARRCFEDRYTIEKVASNLVEIISAHLGKGRDQGAAGGPV